MKTEFKTLDKKLYRFRTDNPDLIKFLDIQKEVSIFVESVLNQVRKGELVEKSVSEAKQELELQNLRLRNKNLEKRNARLDIQNRLTLIHDFHVSPSVAIEITNGNITLDEIFRPKVEKESAGLDENSFCSTCGHVHFSKVGGRSCTSSLCLCGVRG